MSDRTAVPVPPRNRPGPGYVARLKAQHAARAQQTPTGAYRRDAFERAVMSSTVLHPHARLVALVLAHHAGPSGELGEARVPVAARLAEAAGITTRWTHISLQVLQREGYLRRPAGDTGRPRPITLQLPPGSASS